MPIIVTHLLIETATAGPLDSQLKMPYVPVLTSHPTFTQTIL